MFRHAIYFCVFALSLTAAHTEDAAPSNLYVGYGYLSHSLDVDNDAFVNNSLDVTGSEITLGYRVSETLSLEFQRGTFTTDFASIRIQDSIVSVDERDSEITKLSFLFVAPLAPQSNSRMFIRLGSVEIDSDPIVARFQGESLSLNVENESGDVLGAGIDVDVDRLTFRAELIRMYENEDFGLSIAAMYNF